jgi:hypothetical protein
MKKINIKKITALLFLSASLSGCAQKKEIKTQDIMNEPNVQKVLNTYKEIKTYEYNPAYFLHMDTAAGFSFELLINDQLFYTSYSPGTLTGSMPLADVILKSGRQRLKIRMFPPVDDNYVMQTLIEPRDVGLEFRIVYGDEKRDKPRDFHEVFKFELPKFEHPLPYYEVNLEFEAEVPYELEGWTNGVDLTKEDKKELQKEVEEYYRKVIKMYETGDVNGLAGIYYKRQKDIGQTLYRNRKEDYEMLIEEWTKDVNKDQTFELKDYDLRFFGDGKMVALIRNDRYNQRLPALFSENKEINKVYYYYLFLYRPYPGAPLEVIR